MLLFSLGLLAGLVVPRVWKPMLALYLRKEEQFKKEIDKA